MPAASGLISARLPVFIAVTVQGVVKGAGLKRATQGKRTFFCGGAILCIHNPDSCRITCVYKTYLQHT